MSSLPVSPRSPLTLRVLRETHRLTQVEAAARLGLTRSTYDGYEQERRPTPSAVLLRVVKTFVLAPPAVLDLVVWAGSVADPS